MIEVGGPTMGNTNSSWYHIHAMGALSDGTSNSWKFLVCQFMYIGCYKTGRCRSFIGKSLMFLSLIVSFRWEDWGGGAWINKTSSRMYESERICFNVNKIISVCSYNSSRSLGKDLPLCFMFVQNGDERMSFRHAC